MTTASAMMRTKFHQKFESFTPPVLESTEDGSVVDLSAMQGWRARHGAWSFVISRDPENPKASGKFSISIRPMADLRMNAVDEFEQYDTLTAAKDACYNHYTRFRARHEPRLTRSKALPQRGERAVEVTIKS